MYFIASLFQWPAGLELELKYLTSMALPWDVVSSFFSVCNFFLFKPFSLKHPCFKFSRLHIWQPKTQITSSDVLSRSWSTALVLHFNLSAACSGLRVKSLWINSLSALQHRNTHCINGVYCHALLSNLFCVLLIRLPGFLAIPSFKWFLVEQVLWNRSVVAFYPVFTVLLLNAKRKKLEDLPVVLSFWYFLYCILRSSRLHSFDSFF